MHQIQRIGLLGITVLLLLGFWAGLWYQGQRKGNTLIFADEEMTVPDLEEGIIVAEGSAVSGPEADTPPSDRIDRGIPDPYTDNEWFDAGAGRSGTMAVHVVGRVASPGLYFLPQGSRIYDAVMEAEPEEDADLGKINMAMPVEDGMQVRVPIIGKPSPWDGEDYVVKSSDNQEYVSGGSGAGTAAASAESSPGKININKATAKELQALPGIGPSYSQRIIEYREQSGGFKSVEDLQKVKGIGPAKMSDIRDKVCI